MTSGAPAKLYPSDYLIVESYGPDGLVQTLRVVVAVDGRMTLYVEAPASVVHGAERQAVA